MDSLDTPAGETDKILVLEVVSQKIVRRLNWKGLNSGCDWVRSVSSAMFLIVALIAGVFGFWGLEGMAMWIAKVLFVVFLVLFVVSLVFGRRGPL